MVIRQWSTVIRLFDGEVLGLRISYWALAKSATRRLSLNVKYRYHAEAQWHKENAGAFARISFYLLLKCARGATRFANAHIRVEDFLKKTLRLCVFA
jgi:hypothetical protein